jgi:monoamine oxidase
VRFDPPLAWPLDAVASGAVVRIVLAFAGRFWEDRAPRLGFLHGDGAFPTFWADRRRPLVTAWCGGPGARELSRRSEAERVERAVRALSDALGTPAEPHLRGWWTHDWQADPLALGAYSYVTVGGVDRLPELAEPRGALALAGEYVQGSSVSSTVEAALQSGVRAA